MGSRKIVTEKYLAQLAGVNVNTMRRYVMMLRSLVGEYDLLRAQEESVSE